MDFMTFVSDQSLGPAIAKYIMGLCHCYILGNSWFPRCRVFFFHGTLYWSTLRNIYSSEARNMSSINVFCLKTCHHPKTKISLQKRLFLQVANFDHLRFFLMPCQLTMPLTDLKTLLLIMGLS